jgi:cell division protein FtsI/penicillin-binding protein 2
MNLNFKKGSRSKILAVIVFAVMVIFVLRLFYLQVIQYGYYSNLANQEQVKRLTIPAKRGLIYALDGKTAVPLVMNQTVYTVFADPKVTDDDNKIVEVIKRIAGGNAVANLDKLLAKKETRYQVLATKVTRKQAEMIKAENLGGVGFQETIQRVYPEGTLAAQTLGFVDYEGIGRYGVEGYLNKDLTGTDGLLQSVTDVSSVPLTIGNANINQPAVDGKNIVLSIDRNVQSKVEEILKNSLANNGADKGSVVVMDPQTGKIMAMANLPSYDPTKISEIENLSVLNNDVVSYPHEPGSVIKTITMAIGVDKGVVSADSTYNNTDYIQVDDRVISNASLGQTGIITLQHAMNWSLNTGFVTVAMRLGDGSNITRSARDTMYDYYYNKFGLGRLTGVEVDGEVAGTIWSPDTEEGNAVRYSNMSFGQGMNLTMVQVAAAFSSLINGGKYYKPTVIAGSVDKNGKYTEDEKTVASYPISTSTASQLREMIYNARSQMAIVGDKVGYYIGGKTGTAQVLENGSYSTDGATIGTYIGFGGSEELSRYVIMVKLSGDGKSFSGQDSRAIFTDISNWMLSYLEIQPKG